MAFGDYDNKFLETTSEKVLILGRAGVCVCVSILLDFKLQSLGFQQLPWKNYAQMFSSSAYKLWLLPGCTVGQESLLLSETSQSAVEDAERPEVTGEQAGLRVVSETKCPETGHEDITGPPLPAERQRGARDSLRLLPAVH